jgi:uncharacterized Fe-S cluster-containing radical SAM superfamily enzyme
MKHQTKIEYNDFEFIEIPAKRMLRFIFLKYFYFDILMEELEKIKIVKTERKCLYFDEKEQKVNHKFNRIMREGFNNLKSIINGRDAVYIHQNSGIPLVGTNYFGIVDRDSSILEIKPVTGCNLKCIYCSVGESSLKKKADYVVEKDYIINEYEKLVKLKKNKVEAHINPQGEPLIYGDMVELVRGLKNIEKTKKVSFNTNGLLLNKELTDDLIKAGLDQINISLNALDEKTASKLAGAHYNMEKILDLMNYINKKIKLIISPVIVPGINDSEIDKLIKLSKKLNCRIGLQNFLKYKHGFNPVKQRTWEEFYRILDKKEKEHNIKLILDAEDFDIKKDEALEKPFSKNEMVEAQIKMPGRYNNEMIAAAKDRAITVFDTKAKINDVVRVKIIRTKHNIFNAVEA